MVALNSLASPAELRESGLFEAAIGPKETDLEKGDGYRILIDTGAPLRARIFATLEQLDQAQIRPDTDRRFYLVNPAQGITPENVRVPRPPLLEGTYRTIMDVQSERPNMQRQIAEKLVGQPEDEVEEALLGLTEEDRQAIQKLIHSTEIAGSGEHTVSIDTPVAPSSAKTRWATFYDHVKRTAMGLGL